MLKSPDRPNKQTKCDFSKGDIANEEQNTVFAYIQSSFFPLYSKLKQL